MDYCSIKHFFYLQFLGSIVTGNIYHFDLNEDRTQLALAGGFEGISGLEVGPDGYLYVVSLGQGKIFKVVPSD